MIWRFVSGLVSIAVIVLLAFRPIPEPFNFVLLTAAGANLMWQVLKLWRM